MSKLLSLLFAGAGASVVSVGGVYMLKQPGKGGEGSGTDTSEQTQSETKKLLFDGVEDFKTKVDDESAKKCIEGYFDGLKIKTPPESAQEIKNSQPTGDSFFKTNKTDGAAYKSCLLINWKKESYGSDASKKWKGKFVWLWTFVRGDEGFINFNIAETQDNEEQKLKFSGVFYLVGKKTDNKNWEIKFKKNMENSKEASKSDLDTYLPRPNTTVLSEAKDYWELMAHSTSSSDMDKICKQSDTDCKTNQSQDSHVEVKEFTWTGSESGDKTLKDCFVDLNWWSSLYNTTNWDLSTKIANFKGTWTKSQ